jgi:hypothetical protein
MFTVRAPNSAHNGISAGVSFTAGVGHTDNPAALAYFSRAGYTLELDQSTSEPILAALDPSPQGGSEAPADDSEAESSDEVGTPPDVSPFAPGADVAPEHPKTTRKPVTRRSRRR